MDLTVRTELQQSPINGLFNEIEGLKRSVKQQQEKIESIRSQIEAKEQQIIKHIREHGNVLAYKGNDPHVLTIGQKVSSKLDKGTLSADLDMKPSEINVVNVAELVENQRLTSVALKGYFYEESETVLKVKKARKRDMDLLLGGVR